MGYRPESRLLMEPRPNPRYAFQTCLGMNIYSLDSYIHDFVVPHKMNLFMVDLFNQKDLNPGPCSSWQLQELQVKGPLNAP